MGILDLFRRKKDDEDLELSGFADNEGDFEESDDEKPSKSQGRERRHVGDWENVVYSREGVNIDDAASRRGYVQSCLTQMEEGTRQIEALQYEYRTVTGYLHDMELINELPKEERAIINDYAKKIYDNEEQRQKYLKRQGKMTDKEYEHVEKLQGQEDEIIKKMKESEDYHRKIRKDLIRLDNERQAYDLRKIEADKALNTNRNLSIFTVVALLVILIVLVSLQTVMRLDVTLAYMLVILVAALSIVGLYMRHGSCMQERKAVRAAKARLIQLQNTVKVRYVNNLNLLDYMYLKYGVESSSQLQSMIERYHEERAQRIQFEEAEKELADDQRELLRALRNSQIRTPEIWLHQPEALINHNEEVEVRHNLIVQRQSLRKRMDYNREMVIGGARKEIEDLARTYPRYASEILDQVARFQGVEL
ncbi:hypothetical protein [Butyrivibrio fibrisolvens]|jgi:hypothetical protein|uniref:hypothetical protein n=1 Tax=Butyrivibrio fibrisolvens TaxID=831 RepID=UPI0003B506B5|nr:hypothetical protein [Butyrivibrio fibrisolvens]